MVTFLGDFGHISPKTFLCITLATANRKVAQRTLLTTWDLWQRRTRPDPGTTAGSGRHGLHAVLVHVQVLARVLILGCVLILAPTEALMDFS
jgi:hypothetical protein